MDLGGEERIVNKGEEIGGKIKMARGGLRIIEEKRFDGIILYPCSRVYFY